VHLKAWERGAYMRVTGDIIALAPPLIIDKPQIDALFDCLRGVLKEIR